MCTYVEINRAVEKKLQIVGVTLIAAERKTDLQPFVR